MKEGNTYSPDTPTGAAMGPQSAPIGPQRSSALFSGVAPGAGERSRADLILLLGILSLFLCGPLGIVAWVMGSSELKKIRSGLLSRAKTGRVRLGRALGLVGTCIFVASIAFVTYLLPTRITDPGPFFSSEPLSVNQMVFAGEWTGNRGSMIRIYPDGRGDFKTSSTSVHGGRVFISADSLSIGMMGAYKTWQIQQAPHAENGAWVMKLDGETFVRKETGLLVLRMEKTERRYAQPW